MKKDFNKQIPCQSLHLVSYIFVYQRFRSIFHYQSNAGHFSYYQRKFCIEHVYSSNYGTMDYYRKSIVCGFGNYIDDS